MDLQYLIESRQPNEHYLHTGFIDKCTDWLAEMEIPYNLTNDLEMVSFDDPYIKGITFRDDQNKLLEQGLVKGRGV